VVARRCARMLGDWKLRQKQEEAARLESWSVELERIGARSPRLQWRRRQDQDIGPCCANNQSSCALMRGGYDAHVSRPDRLNDVEPGNFSDCDEPRCAGVPVHRAGPGVTLRT
jgi:hypothetical protein